MSVSAIPLTENASICSDEAFSALKCQPEVFEAIVATSVFSVVVKRSKVMSLI